MLPIAKRRRLEQTTRALHKPFVSPLKKPEQVQPSANSEYNGNAQQYKPSTLAHTIAQTSSGSCSDASVSRVSASPARGTPADGSPWRKTKVAAARPIQRKDAAELALQKELTKLEFQIRNLHNDLDVFKQAAALQNSTTDADLKDLTIKWQVASQNIADELFGTVKERVQRMGGVAAWRESERQKHDRPIFAEEPAQVDDADCEFDSQGEELPEEEQQWRKAQKVKAHEEAMDASDPPDLPAETEDTTAKVWQENNADNNSFTMDMMLRSLNIPFDVIGYDKSAQHWLS